MVSTTQTEPKHLQLLVRNVTSLADGVLGLTLVSADGLALPGWSAGAHISLTLASGAVRAYSLCGDPAERCEYQIAVQREDLGRGGSLEIHERQLAGKHLKVSPPVNVFEMVDADHYVFIAGGIGITPLLPMLRKVVAGSASWELHYLGKRRQRMAFLDELQCLGVGVRGLVNVVARDQSPRWDLKAALLNIPADAAVYCCGPNELLNQLESAHANSTVPFSLHMERFGRIEMLPVQERAEAPPPDEDLQPCDPQGEFEIELARDGLIIKVAAGESVLEAVRGVRTGLSFSCSDGYCGTCETRVLSGIPDHRDSVLTYAEKHANKSMMICVSRACTRRLRLDL